MTEKEILEEYKFLLEEYQKIDFQKNKIFCFQSFGVGLGSTLLELITNKEIFSPIFLGGIIYFGTKNILDKDLFSYPIINHSLYKKILNDYQIYNQNISNLINKSNQNNPAFIAGIYKVLLNKGYFSYNKCIHNTNINNPYFILPKEHLGLYLIKGNYNNKYITINFMDILNELNIINATSPIYINQKTKLDNFLEYLTSKIIGNYWINICKSIDNNEVYYIDILNELFYQKKNKYTLNYYNCEAERNLSIPIKFLSEKIYQGKENVDVVKELLKYNNAHQKEINKYYLLGKKYTEENIELFELFYNDNKNILIDIKTNLSKLENTITKYETAKIIKTKTNKHY